MKANFLLGILMGLATGAVAAGGGDGSVLRFATAGGDRLSGSIVSFEDGRLRWESPLLEQPADFSLGSLLELTLPTITHEPWKDHEATLTIVPWPNDAVPAQLKGRLVAVGEEFVTLDTWYAGILQIRRSMIKSLEVEDHATRIYSGPSGLDGWVQAEKEPAWSYASGALHAGGSKVLDRDMKLPDAVVFAFDVGWQGTLGLDVKLFTRGVGNDSEGGYQVALTGSYARIRKSGVMNTGEQGDNLQELRENEKVRMELRASRKTGVVCLYVNGRQALQWKDQNPGKGILGGCVRLGMTASSSVSRVSISRIKVTAWDGEVEEFDQEAQFALLGIGGFGNRGILPAPKAKAPAAADTSGRMKLRNGDSVEGEVTAISDGKVTIKTTLAEVSLPISRLRNVVLKNPSPEEPIRRNGNVRAWFADGSAMVFRMDELTRDEIVGSSQVFGSARFRLSAFNRIEFNLHDPVVAQCRESAAPVAAAEVQE